MDIRKIKKILITIFACICSIQTIQSFAALQCVDPVIKLNKSVPNSILVGTPVTITGIASDGYNNDLTINWNFGDGQPDQSINIKPNGDTRISKTYTYQQVGNGTFQVTATATDSGGRSATDTVNVSVFNTLPVANAGGPYIGYPGQSIPLNGLGSFDLDNQPLSYFWKLCDTCEYKNLGPQPSVSFQEVGDHIVTLKVSDGYQESVPHQAVVTISAIPVANTGGPYLVEVNKPIKLNGSLSSDDLLSYDQLNYLWTFSDDNSTATGFSPSHVFNTAGEFQVTLVVNDGISDSPPASTIVRVVEYDPDLNKGEFDCNGSNPINGATGNKYQVETDYVGNGPFPLIFQRHYNSTQDTIGENGSVAAHWSGTYDRFIVLGKNLTTDIARVHRENGSVITFTKDTSSNEWIAPKVVTESLDELSNGWNFRNNKNEIEFYENINGRGRLKTIKNQQGLILTLNYIGNKLDTVEDEFGKKIQFEYEGRWLKKILIANINNTQLFATYYHDVHYNLVRVVYGLDPTNQFSSLLYKIYTYAKHNVSNHLLHSIYANKKREVRFKYDEVGRAISSTRGANTVSFDFSQPGHRTVITDGNQISRTYQYHNALGKMVVEKIDGERCNVCGGLGKNNTFDPITGFLDSTTDFNGVTSIFIVNERGLPTQKIEAVGELDTNGENIERSVSIDWHNEYRLPTCIVEPMRSIMFDYETNSGRLSSKTIIDTKSITSETDKHCNIAINNGTLNKRSWKYTYYANNLLHQVDGPRTDVLDVTTFAYDTSTGRLIEIKNPLGHITRFTDFNPLFDKPTRIENPNGLVTRISYDAIGRVDIVSVGNGVGDGVVGNGGSNQITDYTYGVGGLLSSVDFTDGSRIEFSYDVNNEIKSITDIEGNRIVFERDSLGNINSTTVVNASGIVKRKSAAVFNALNRLEQLIGSAVPPQITRFIDPRNGNDAYDANGNLLYISDPLHHVTEYVYDGLNRLKLITDAKEGLTKYTYNSQNRIETVTDPGNLETVYNYDGLGNLMSISSPDSGLQKFTAYDSVGNLRTAIDANNKTTEYTYDELNRIDSVNYNNTLLISYIYDTGGAAANALGHLTSVIEPNVTTSYSYDIFGRINTKSQSIGSTTLVIDYDYNHDGTLAKIILPSGKQIKYGYDFSTKLVSSISRQEVSTIDNLISSIQYDPFGPITNWVYNSGGRVDLNYDLDGQITDYNLSSRARKIKYTLAGHVHKITDDVNNVLAEYGYDELYRLTSYTSQFGEIQKYEYDNGGVGVGNRTTTTVGEQAHVPYTYYANSNRIKSIGTGPDILYDNAGNITDDNRYVYHYDDRGRIVRVEDKLTTTDIATYTINEFGQRVRKISTSNLFGDADGNGVIDANDRFPAISAVLGQSSAGNPDCDQDTRAVVLDLLCINNKIINGTNTSNTLYFYDINGNLIGEYDDTGNVIREYIWHAGRPMVMLAGEEPYYIYSDHLNTPRAVTDKNNSTIWRWDNNDPFGANPPNVDADNNGTPFTFNLRFPGQYFDAETGLHYNEQRTYNPQTGSYLESDPIGLNGGLNLYTYAYSNPISWIDPNGLEATVGIHDDAVARSALTEDELIDVGIGFLPGSGIYDAYTTGGILGAVILATELPVVKQVKGFCKAIAKAFKKTDSNVAKGLTKEQQKGIRSLEKRIAEHEKKLQEFKDNPTVRPGMEKLPKEVIQRQQQRRIEHLETEISTFRNNIDKIKRGEID